MKFIFSIVCFLLTIQISSQEKISGYIHDENEKPLAGANVFLKGTYDGAVTDTSGHFKFNAYTNDSSVLVVSFIGYSTFETKLSEIIERQTIKITLKENAINAETVVITAGTFQAGEKSRAVLLSPVEIATTASSDGDVYGALRTFPGVQKQGETGKIIVRGRR